MQSIQRWERPPDGWAKPLEGFIGLDPPVKTFWTRGQHELQQLGPRVAVVGSRSPTSYGRDQAQRFAGALARAGCVVVSGLARGVDGIAHEAVLDEGGATIAVLGCGVDQPWPVGPLTERMTHEGLLLSEFGPGISPRRNHFPMRNRIIAALCDATLVIEAAHRSGSLITARWAADLGRAVFVVPQAVDHPLGLGALRLLREGATAVGSPGQLLTDLESLRGTSRAGGEWGEHVGDMDPILRALEGDALSVESLSSRVNQPVLETSIRLVDLELDGRVRRIPGGLWVVAARQQSQ
ncbi:MAG TPA: DNA-protecting protein DprA [Planctomycetes bacterium]|nr:DNA-protecting protein DprA [Planctomycetota bacterium]HIL38104.1 DNA-protecting protein DprA [Planctomycetota bacterium]